MRLIIHIGLNKAASTWIQHSLASCRSKSLFYENVDDYFLNHYILSTDLAQGNQDEAVKWIQNYALKAKDNGAECAIISSEDIWHQLLFNETATRSLEIARNSLIATANIETRYLIVKRDFKKWAHAHCMQIVRNEGGLTRERLYDLFRSSVTIAQFPALSVKRLPVNSVDIISCDKCDLAQSIQQLISPSFKGLDRFINESRKNQSACDLLSGALRSIYSFHNNLHPNTTSCDEVVNNFIKSWDQALEQNGTRAIYSVIDNFEKSFSDILHSEIARLENTMSDTESEFWLVR